MLEKGWLKGLEPSTPRSTIELPCDLSVTDKELASTLSLACTSACTGDSENANADLAALAAALRSLPADARAALVQLLTEDGQAKSEV